MRFAEGVIYFQRLHRRLLRLRPRLPRKHHIKESKRIVGSCHSDIGQRVAWIFFDSLLKVLDAFPPSFWRPPVQVMASHQIKLIGFGAFSIAFRQSLLLLTAQPKS